jgi:hypothetical protein
VCCVPRPRKSDESCRKRTSLRIESARPHEDEVHSLNDEDNQTQKVIRSLRLGIVSACLGPGKVTNLAENGPHPFEFMRSLTGFVGGTPTTAPVLRRVAAAACLQRVRTPICSGAAGAAASNFQQLAGVTAAVVRGGQGAAFWQLVIAFVCGGLFVTCSIGFLVLAYTYGATNVDRAKKMISLVVRRTVRVCDLACSTMCLHLACAHAATRWALPRACPRSLLPVRHRDDHDRRGEHGALAPAPPWRTVSARD